MSKKNELLLYIITKKALEQYNMDYYHIDKYGEPKVDVYDLSKLNGSLMHNMDIASRCATDITLLRNVFGANDKVLKRLDSFNHLVYPDIANAIRKFDAVTSDTDYIGKFSDRELKEYSIQKTYKLKKVIYSKRYVVIDYKIYNEGKRSTHKLYVSGGDMNDFELVITDIIKQKLKKFYSVIQY